MKTITLDFTEDEYKLLERLTVLEKGRLPVFFMRDTEADFESVRSLMHKGFIAGHVSHFDEEVAIYRVMLSSAGVYVMNVQFPPVRILSMEDEL